MQRISYQKLNRSGTLTFPIILVQSPTQSRPGTSGPNIVLDTSLFRRRSQRCERDKNLDDLGDVVAGAEDGDCAGDEGSC
jgi:hypothetical protein